jgi:hypothetical protein
MITYNNYEGRSMRKDSIRKFFEIVVILAMIFGWVIMLSIGFKIDESVYQQASERNLSRFNPMRYGFYIFLISTIVLVFISRRRLFNERFSLALIIFGMISLCQPFTIVLYRCGFQTLLVGTLAFIIVSHMKPETQTSKP